MMPKGQQLLLPVSPVFIVASFLVGLSINILPLGRVVWTPDWLMVLLAFWGIHQPQRVGVSVAFILGLCMDVSQSALMGQHALVYCLLMYAAQMSSRRMLWFNVWWQALQMIPLFAGAHAVELILRLLSGGTLPGMEGLIAPALEAALWPVATWILLAPQRRPPDPDENRPL
ncbi:rod shape-determining protein MreD [Diaphorobacter sp.]|uniref:rod shape-determining protein MreD n=1 Tax=Diaphorobacter sp. TaxID=1934310 RepID=UPI0028AC406B|nr:rod shape-determining protein MreD [Diaphorobacter sp.]